MFYYKIYFIKSDLMNRSTDECSTACAKFTNYKPNTNKLTIQQNKSH
jgi:hypothetical protein